MSNMWDLESIQMKNARQASWKVSNIKKLLMSPMSIGLVGYKIK